MCGLVSRVCASRRRTMLFGKVCGNVQKEYVSSLKCYFPPPWDFYIISIESRGDVDMTAKEGCVPMSLHFRQPPTLEKRASPIFAVNVATSP